MIYDTLNNLPNYLGMSENLDAVIEYVMALDNWGGCSGYRRS